MLGREMLLQGAVPPPQVTMREVLFGATNKVNHFNFVKVNADDSITHFTDSLPGGFTGSMETISQDNGATLLAGCSSQGIWKYDPMNKSPWVKIFSYSHAFSNIAASLDGKHIYQACLTYGLYRTNDSGGSWVRTTPDTTCSYIDCSHDGQIVVSANHTTGKVIMSEDYGSTWKEIMAPGTNPNYAKAVAVDPSNNIKRILINQYSYCMEYRRDLGHLISLSQYGYGKYVYGLNVSDNGQHILTSGWYRPLMISNNGGGTFKEKLTGKNYKWSTAYVSPSGKVMLMYEYTNSPARLWYSTDFGDTWNYYN